MVKERESMSSSRLMVLVELANDDSDVLNDVLKAAYEVAVYLLEEGCHLHTITGVLFKGI